jgi:hypothetical protein
VRCGDDVRLFCVRPCKRVAYSAATAAAGAIVAIVLNRRCSLQMLRAADLQIATSTSMTAPPTVRATFAHLALLRRTTGETR